MAAYNRFVVIGLSAALAMAATSVLAVDTAPLVQDKDGSEQPVTDTWITTKVKSTLLATEGVAGSDINVSTENGVVTLAGVLDSQAAVDKALEVTRGIEGVTNVDARALKTR